MIITTERLTAVKGQFGDSLGNLCQVVVSENYQEGNLRDGMIVTWRL
jgi:hypothetical protein